MLRSSDAQPNTPVRNNTTNKKLTFSFGKKGFFSILVPFKLCEPACGLSFTKYTVLHVFVTLQLLFLDIYEKSEFRVANVGISTLRALMWHS